MTTIAVADFLLLADSIAKQEIILDAAMGTGIEADTMSIGGQNNLTKVLALNDAEQELDLLPGFEAASRKAKTSPSGILLFNEGCVALNKHTDGVDAYLTTKAERVAPEFKTVFEMVTGFTLSPANTFSPVVDPIATFDVTGAGTGTFTPGAPIDDTKYYAANLILYVSGGATGAAQGTYTITLTKWDGASESKDVVVPGSTAENTEFDVGTHPGDIYKDVTLISVALGTNGDQVKIKSELERAVVL